MIVKNLIRLLPIIGIIGAIYLLITLSPMNKEYWSTEGADEIRESKRGTFLSVISAIFMNIIGIALVNIGVPENLIITNYGFVLGPIIGYMLDTGLGTDGGLKQTKKGFLHGASYVFGKLMSFEFIRYISTVFLDMFISNPILDILQMQVSESGILDSMSKSTHSASFYDKFLVKNFPSIAQSIVGFITFESYTNQTRFAWAYPNKKLPKKDRIQSSTIMIGTAVAAVAFLSYYKLYGMIKNEVSSNLVTTKLVFVLSAIGLLYLLSSTKNLDAPVADDDKDDKDDRDDDKDDKDDNEDDKDNTYLSNWDKLKPFFGIIFFLIILTYGLIYPVTSTIAAY